MSAPDYANSWWYRLDEVELVESAPAATGWYVVSEWCDDDYAYRPAHLVWAQSEADASATGRTLDSREPISKRIEIPKTPTPGTRVSL